MQWRVSAEWAWQERSVTGRTLFACLRAVQGHLDGLEPPQINDMLLATVDELTKAEILFAERQGN